jgi:hypothetical protein
LSSYIDKCIKNETLSISLHQAQASMSHSRLFERRTVLI